MALLPPLWISCCCCYPCFLQTLGEVVGPGESDLGGGARQHAAGVLQDQWTFFEAKHKELQVFGRCCWNVVSFWQVFL